jgi:outer membrane immunogenic protein
MIRRLLLAATALAAIAGPALAADLPYREAPPAYTPPVPLFTWSGLYLGGQLGYAWGNDEYTVASPFSIYSSHFGPSGIIGGAHVGYNAQFNQIVVGVEGDVEGSGYKKTFNSNFIAYGTEIPVQGSIRARVGVALDRALIYATAGGAFASLKNTYASFLGYDTLSKTRAGWTVGGGIEYALTGNWSVRAEYRYTDYGSVQDYPYNSAPGAIVRHKETENAIRAGFSYKFDPFAGPATARY